MLRAGFLYISFGRMFGMQISEGEVKCARLYPQQITEETMLEKSVYQSIGRSPSICRDNAVRNKGKEELHKKRVLLMTYLGFRFRNFKIPKNR